MSQLYDATGRGYGAKVDKHSRLYVRSLSLPESAQISAEKGEGYNITTDILTFNSTNEHAIMFLKNKRTDAELILSTIIYSWNDGDTNHNRSIFKRVYRNPPDPTGNYITKVCQNLNFSSAKEPIDECYIWDGNNDGMNIDLTGLESLSTDVVKGAVAYRGLEDVRLSYNNAILFTFQPEEIGKCSISLKYYFNNT